MTFASAMKGRVMSYFMSGECGQKQENVSGRCRGVQLGWGVEKGWVDGWDGTRDRWLTEDGLYIINKKDV